MTDYYELTADDAYSAAGAALVLLGDGDGTLHDDPCAVFDRHLHRLGPTATLAWIYLSRRLASGHPEIAVVALAGWLGVRPAVALHALDRLVRLGYAHRSGATFVIRTTL